MDERRRKDLLTYVRKDVLRLDSTKSTMTQNIWDNGYVKENVMPSIRTKTTSWSSHINVCKDKVKVT